MKSCQARPFSVTRKEKVSDHGSKTKQRQEWEIFQKGKIMTLSLEIMAQIRASPTMIWGWFDLEEMKAWSHIFHLTPKSRKMGYLSLLNPPWLEWAVGDIPLRRANDGGSKSFRIKSPITAFVGAKLK